MPRGATRGGTSGEEVTPGYCSPRWTLGGSVRGRVINGCRQLTLVQVPQPRLTNMPSVGAIVTVVGPDA
jgi:hypothetical protein